MFDSPTNVADSWKRDVAPGDILLFAYPVADPDSCARPKVRPCLVLETEDHETGKHILLAYGTSQPPKGPRGYDITVRGASGLLVAGLEKPTRFIGSRLLSVSVENSKFGIRDRATPVIGHLSSSALARMNLVRARLHAERDMASERRKERASKRSFLVERRTRKKLVSLA